MPHSVNFILHHQCHHGHSSNKHQVVSQQTLQQQLPTVAKHMTCNIRSIPILAGSYNIAACLFFLQNISTIQYIFSEICKVRHLQCQDNLQCQDKICGSFKQKYEYLYLQWLDTRHAMTSFQGYRVVLI